MWPLSLRRGGGKAIVVEFYFFCGFPYILYQLQKYTRTSDFLGIYWEGCNLSPYSYTIFLASCSLLINNNLVKTCFKRVFFASHDKSVVFMFFSMNQGFNIFFMILGLNFYCMPWNYLQFFAFFFKID